MGCCSKTRFLQTVLVLQIVTTALRQVFDFLGFMWVPILTNFFNIVFCILGYFGAHEYRYRYVLSYCTWTVLWVAWNLFVICFYFEIGILEKNGDALNMGLGSYSWWEVNGPGCRPTFPVNMTEEELIDSEPLKPLKVTGCYVAYEIVEASQAAVQAFLGLIGEVIAIFAIRSMLDEDDSSQLVGKKSRPSSIYSIEYSQENARSATPDRVSSTSRANAVAHHNRGAALDDDDDDVDEAGGGGPHAKPMTPRRVKRRSGSRNSTRSRHGGSGQQHSNPVNRLLEQQERRLAGHSNPTYQSSSQHSLDRPPSSFSNYHGQRSFGAAAASAAAVSHNPGPSTSAGGYRNSYRRHQHHQHQAPPPYNGHVRPHSSYTNSETVL
ncbi:sodium/potassium-transporting ATPase subunit beta-1-interacting protein [Cloeon dipterum]|uniref:sodium/potassium-transporting ATPase subunit beta-1-interacting protein n=1 Tax=Cloeon dipterum TaxID=197152 RepID=UPI00321F9E2F